ncbi:Endochitinase [Micromonospora noduli]|nr:Endochitinase [Micromonospora noduli]
MDMVRNLAAASSIANGIPSSARQIRAIVDNVRSSTARSLRTATARSRSNRTAGEVSISLGSASTSGRASGATGQSASPVMPSGSLLVARIRSRRHSPSSRSASTAADSITCSQLSRISSASRSRIAATSRSINSMLGASPSRASRSPSPVSVACTTSPSAPMAANSTSQAPSGRLSSILRAVSVASRVFPEPPGPIRVVSRCSATSAPTSATASSLPMKLLNSARRLVFRFSSGRCTSPRRSATCNAASSGEGSTPSASARASLVR